MQLEFFGSQVSRLFRLGLSAKKGSKICGNVIPLQSEFFKCQTPSKISFTVIAFEWHSEKSMVVSSDVL